MGRGCVKFRCETLRDTHFDAANAASGAEMSEDENNGANDKAFDGAHPRQAGCVPLLPFPPGLRSAPRWRLALCGPLDATSKIPVVGPVRGLAWPVMTTIRHCMPEP